MIFLSDLPVVTCLTPDTPVVSSPENEVERPSANVTYLPVPENGNYIPNKSSTNPYIVCYPKFLLCLRIDPAHISSKVYFKCNQYHLRDGCLSAILWMA